MTNRRPHVSPRPSRTYRSANDSGTYLFILQMWTLVSVFLTHPARRSYLRLLLKFKLHRHRSYHDVEQRLWKEMCVIDNMKKRSSRSYILPLTSSLTVWEVQETSREPDAANLEHRKNGKGISIKISRLKNLESSGGRLPKHIFVVKWSLIVRWNMFKAKIRVDRIFKIERCLEIAL